MGRSKSIGCSPLKPTSCPFEILRPDKYFVKPEPLAIIKSSKPDFFS